MRLYSYTGAIIFLLTAQHAFGAVPSFISPNPAGETISMPETTPLGTQIYTIDANDNDDHTGASIAYLLENQDPTDRFTLNGKVLETNSEFDYESEPTSYQLTFSATTFNGSVTAVLTVNISDVNDELPNLTGPTTINIDEEQTIGTILATFNATDADESDELRFSLSGDDIYFDIDAVSGEIDNTQVMDYESATKTTFVLAVTVRDAVGHSDTQLVTINLQNINDNPPVFLDPLPDGSSIKGIPETTPTDSAIYTIVATDADGDSITYSITNQAPIELFRLEEGILYTNGVFDFETGPRGFHITLNAASAIDSASTNLTITIGDVNDERPSITGQLSVDFDEEQSVGTTVLAGLVVNDIDVGDILTFSISGDDIYFDIDDRTGEITNTQVLDYESAGKTSFDLTVTVRDAVGHSDSHSLTINLKNINDNPIVFLRPFPDGSSTKGILETTPTGTPIYTIETTDADRDDIICSVTDQSPTVMFRLEGNKLYTGGGFDYETGPASFHLTLRCHNAADVSDSAATNLTVTIEDVNDEIPLITGKSYVDFDEEQSVGTNVLAEINANDSDVDDVLTYSIRGDDIYFRIDDRTGAISNSKVLDFEAVSKTTFDLTVTVTDAVGHSDSHALTINLRNINDNMPVFLSPLPDRTSRQHVLETTPSNTPVYTIEATDADGDNIVYGIIDQSPIARFRLEGQILYTEGDFDFERGETSFSLTISANSSDDTITTDLTIEIDDVNDETPIISGMSIININEEQPAGTVLSTGIVVDDADAGDTLSYSLRGDDIYFEIQDSSTGIITTNAKLDYETLTKTTFWVTLTVRDVADHSATQLLTINVMNIDDNGPVFTNPLQTGASVKTLPETIAQGTSVYRITANDADGDTVSYQMESQNPATPVRFTLIGSDVRTMNIFDFETEPTAYTLTFSATSTNRTVTATLTIHIEDVNDEEPVFTGGFTAEIEEEQPAGTTVPTTFTVTDSDTDDELSYSFIGDSSYFSIDSNGVITTAQVLDFETTTHTTFFLTISVTDEVGHSATQAIAIALLNINDNVLTFINPPSSGGSSKNIPESTNVGTPIYTIEAEDADVEEDGINYFIVGQDPESPLMFYLDGRTLTTSAAFDYDEGPKSYRVTFNATSTFDSAGTSVSESTTSVLTVIIQDVNDEPPIITGGPFNVTINEEQAIGSVVPLTLTVTDPDEDDVLVYSLSGEDSNFEIDSATGMIRTKQVLDYETATQTTFTLTVTVRDVADHSATQQITISLQNINDNTPEFSPNIYYVDVQENTTMGFDIVQLGVQDADQDAVILNIASGDDINIPKFMISDKTIQTSNSPIDFESLGGQNYEYTLSVTASDGTLTATATVHVQVTGRNEFDPVWSTFDRNPNLAENVLIGTTIVTLSAADADEGTDGVISFSIDSVASSPTGRPVDGLFHVDKSSGVITTTSNSFDADITTGGVEYYDIVVRAADGRATDSDRRFIVETIRVTLSDVNDNTPAFAETLVHVVIPETDLPGATVQELSANDADQQSSLTYTLDTAASTPPSYATFFAIEEENKIKLKATVDLDYVGSDDTFHLVVVAVDGGNSALSGTTTILVTITSVNEYAPVFNGPYATALPENADIDVTVITVSADDRDSGADGQVSYSITGDTDKQFSINPLTGVVKLAKELDYETKTQYSLTVQASDGGNPSLENTTTLTIDILDVDDNILTCDDTSISVSILETRDANDVVAAVSCDDLDESDTVVYSIKSGDSTVFKIDDASGQITLVRAVDYDNGDNFFILVIAITSGKDNIDVSVSITVKPENEHAPVFNNPDEVTLPEDAEVGTTISALFATDNDTSPHDIVRYTLNSVSNVGSSLFSISQSTGVIRLVDSLDYDTLPTPKAYVIVVWAVDGGSPEKTGSGTLTINVSDVNDNIPVCSKYSHALTVAEDAAVDSVLIADFGCSDADSGTVLQYILQQNPPTPFRIEETGSPQLLIDAVLNYDLISSYTLIMSVSDGIHTTEVDIDIIIDDVNNGPPVFPQLQYSATVSEADSVGTSVITILANDPDADTSQYGKLIYTFTVNMDTKFNIDPNFGAVTVAGVLDADSVSEYSLVVQAADGGNLKATTTCNVTVLDVNDNKPACSHYSFTVTIPESTTAPADIKTLSCSDKDVTSSLQYAVSSGDTSLFQMNQNVLQLTAEIDYDVILSDVYSVTIDVSDGENTVQISGLITITGINENSPSFNPGTYQVNQAEDIAVGSTIATVTATDTDRGETVEYSFTSGVAEFKIEPFSGEIILLTALDRERDANYELFVQATDGLNFVTATVSITVRDVNDNTPVFNPTSYRKEFARQEQIHSIQSRPRGTSSRETNRTLSKSELCCLMSALARVSVVTREGRQHLGRINKKGFKDNFVIISTLKVCYMSEVCTAGYTLSTMAKELPYAGVRPGEILTKQIRNLGDVIDGRLHETLYKKSVGDFTKKFCLIRYDTAKGETLSDVIKQQLKLDMEHYRLITADSNPYQ